ncbi:hypothetical protein MNO14_09900 [Luteimonas sp. S4-F44]|uniref:hypothetical protein n=1 Tax=Luteimonas sp. S4-F44 TaxID=2925842 RepID=UPI001F537CC1|nr:hypothetical protein [Luteimonas sp. S4-F44]UNK41295.1 hypothetical protein MNO14_09900 [Luteimonas sp. S4-F44]
MTAPRKDDYWFPAKSFGWGWGLPRRWQGWAVLAVYAISVVVVLLRFPPQRDPAAFFGCLSLATALLIATCALKGEPARWRWHR